ncbi:hypothetical protein ACK11Z_03685 [Methanoculleus bourgensis]|nr:hypothetical protein [Methanoculleus bourgensis]NQS74629.1 hypothetical protein [Methanoculleus sp.]
MDLQDAVVMMLALVVFTAILFSPSPTPLDAAGSPDPGPPQPAPVQNLSSVLAGAGERFLDGQPLNVAPVPVQEGSDDPVVPDENTTSPGENSTAIVPDYDDDELVGLVENSSVSLMLLSLQSTSALYSWDEKSVKENAASLQAFAKTVLRDAEKLEVSEFQEPVKAAFTSSLKSYVAAGETLQGNDPLNSTKVDTALGEIQWGSIHLREAFEGLDHPVLHVPQEVVEVNFSGSRSHTGSGTGEELALLQRYLYEDRNRANDISLMLAAAREIGAYYQFNGSGEVVAADPGRMFLLVEVKATNLGHKGDNRVYRIRTPDISAFTLHCRDNTYSPIKLAPRTSLGEPYGAATLDRYEKKVGYIIFDVPEALAIDECYVQVDLGGGESPVWALGKTL